MTKFPPHLIEEFKTTHLNYGPEFWTWKKCNFCQERFTFENHSKKQIELIFCETDQVNEYLASRGIEVKWYHKSCLVRWNEVFKKVFKEKCSP